MIINVVDGIGNRDLAPDGTERPPRREYMYTYLVNPDYQIPSQ